MERVTINGLRFSPSDTVRVFYNGEINEITADRVKPGDCIIVDGQNIKVTTVKTTGFQRNRAWQPHLRQSFHSQ